MNPPIHEASQAEYRRVPPFERVFGLLLFLCGAGGVLLGAYLTTIRPEVRSVAAKLSHQSTTHFIMPKTPQPPKAKSVNTREVQKPVDLTQKPQLAQPEEQPRTTPPAQPARKVYGLRRVYSTGLGSGSSMAEAVIGKLGNTLNKDIDTLTATQQEIKGQVVSATTVTSAPKFKKQVKPAYTQAMLDNRIQGVVKVKVLVDIDGKVKKAQALNDIGFEAAKRALEATLAMEFFPALRGSEPVAVWIIVPIRFLLLG